MLDAAGAHLTDLEVRDCDRLVGEGPAVRSGGVWLDPYLDYARIVARLPERSPSLRHLSMRRSQPCHPGQGEVGRFVGSLVAALPRLVRLTMLRLPHCDLDPDDLATLLPACSTVKGLDLSGNRFGPARDGDVANSAARQFLRCFDGDLLPALEHLSLLDCRMSAADVGLLRDEAPLLAAANGLALRRVYLGRDDRVRAFGEFWERETLRLRHVPPLGRIAARAVSALSRPPPSDLPH